VPKRILLLLAASVAVTGCANETTRGALSMQAGAATNASMLGASSIAAEHDADLKRAAKQTVSAKMLAAIALERVTGRTADPARFGELR
jgi:hypothetical protein